MSGQQLPLALDRDPPKVPRRAALRHHHVPPQAHKPVPEALAHEERHQTQDEAVVAWLRAHPGRWTPYDVADALGLCINSSRRALSNGTRAGHLTKHKADRRPAGPWGEKSATWEAMCTAQQWSESQDEQFNSPR